MAKKTFRRPSASIMEIFVDPLFGAFGAFLFIFLMTILMIGVQIIPSDPVVVTKKLPPAYNGVARIRK